VRRASDILIERVTVASARSGGIVTEKGCWRITVRDFTAYDNHFDGLAAYETEDSLFSGLSLHDNLAAGLSLDLGFNHNVVGDAVITGSGSVGIFMIEAQDNIFHDIQIRDSHEHGVFLAEGADASMIATGNTFTGLVISDSGQTADPVTEGYCVDGFVGGVGICLNNTSLADNLLVGAQFINNQGGCVKEASAGLLQDFATICR